jgi:hypothetical protein
MYLQQITHSFKQGTLKVSPLICEDLKRISKMKRDYDVKILEKQYKKGDLVYVLDTASIKGKCRKLSPPWKGPGIVFPIQPSLTFLKPNRYLSVPTCFETVMIGCKNDSLQFNFVDIWC